MTRDPFEDIREALSREGTVEESIAEIRLDPGRAARAGIPEVVLAERKTAADVATSLMRLADTQGRSLASRVRDDQVAELRQSIGEPYTFDIDDMARVAIVATPGYELTSGSGGRIGVISAGASDRPIAREAMIMALEMGCDVMFKSDVGVAGLHRLVHPLNQISAFNPHAIVVAAGMDGALPSVIAGLVPIPVIGLPVSVGYGFGGDGVGALMSMLQSCAPGLAVVNIDNGIGAGSMAALIANRVVAESGLFVGEEGEEEF
ncbi:MAG: nickel pincer cofactor biosynthesis protein LarB [Thermomicrobiales bacterium]